MKLDLDLERWTVTDAAELYDVARWGKGYFSVNDDGHVRVHPTKDPERSIDLKQLVDRLQLRGIDLPILIRFADILKHRLGEIHDAFAGAITEHQLPGQLLLRLSDQGQPAAAGGRGGAATSASRISFGLEAGSKPELLAVVAMAANDTPIICNGFKDAEFIEMAMLAQKIGRQIIPVVEKYTELELILQVRREGRRAPARSACASSWPRRGSGRWQSVGRLPLEVRPDRHRDPARARRAESRAAWKTASSCCTSTWAARSPTSATSRAR